ncbi:unnamed protein product [Adineta steineri]|uniref:Carotenoid 1,2-hydratase n=1 Tax=Adineta steineri TaxID=433720 RepID=A0A816EPP4_9BILA|nr:unnamed protein product [Adineta steineri]CAF1648755.1 unnamed protein product [Adineta steineri]
MLFKKEILFIFTFLIILIGCKAEICPDNETLSLESDGYQYIRGKDPLISALYREWWFFALYDPIVDIGFCMGYGVADPAKTFSLQSSDIAGMLWTSVSNNTGQDPIGILDTYSYEDFSAHKQNANVTVGKQNSIKVLDDRTYEVVGSSRNGQINWSLTFKQMSYACRQRIDVPQLLELDWISYMPSANVYGVIQYNNTRVTINTTAYHDHNYGAWPTNLFNWIWSQFHRIDKEFSFVLGSYHIPLTNEYIGYVFIRWRNLRIKIGTLCGNAFHLTPLEWQIVDNKKYAIHTRVQTENKNYKIDIAYKARVSNNNPGGRGLGLDVFEQISQYQVSFYENQGGNWKVLEQNLTGYGFSEWSHVGF